MAKKDTTIQKLLRIFRMGCVLFILLSIAFVFIIIFRPKAFWGPIAHFLNTGIELPSETPISIEAAKNYLEKQLDVSSEIIITEDVLTTLSRENVNELPFLTFKIEEGKINAYWQLDEKDGVKLYGYANLDKISEPIESVDVFTDLKVKDFGLPRISSPKFLNKALFSGAKRIFEFTKDDEDEKSLIFTLIGASSTYEFIDIRIEDGQIVILLDTENSFYD